MTNPHPTQSIAVVGAGAVGCFFGGMLAIAGHSVTLIGRRHHVQAINQNGLRLEHLNFDLNIPINASVEIKDISEADIVLVCVKSSDTKQTAQLMLPYLKSNAIVLSFQNGVDNAEILTTELNRSCYPAVVYVASAMAGNGHVKHFGRGELVIGSLTGSSTSLESVANLFSHAKIPTEISADIKQALWSKFLVNCTYNAISAIGKINYSKMVSVKDVNDLITGITKEFLLVANKEGVKLSFDDAMTMNLNISKTMPNQRSSMFQDLLRGKTTEIESLNGLIVKKGIEFGIPTPLNETIYTLIKVLETNQVVN